MPKHSRKQRKRRRLDANQLAALMVAKVTGQPLPDLQGKNPAAVMLGRLGGLKGGPARRDKLTPAQRSASASTAARARWAKLKQQP